jgi:hypothetical protein
MILVKQSVSIADKYGLKVCLLDDVKQQVIAYFYDEALAEVAAGCLNNFQTLFESDPVPSLGNLLTFYHFGFTK